MFNLIKNSRKLTQTIDLKHCIATSAQLLQNFNYNLNKFNDIHIKQDHIIKFDQETNSNSLLFESSLKDALSTWVNEKRTAVWIYLPIHLSHLATISAKHGFKYHHAENDQAVLCKWLQDDRESKIPLFATHQVGVAGVVYRKDTNQILCIQDRLMKKYLWKFPGGAANLSESIDETSVREVFEETGIKSKFASVIGFRQQHNYPGGHGRSDLYVICRLEPLTYDINACTDEIKACEWIDLDEMCNYTESKLTQLTAESIWFGKENGFDKVDIRPKEMASVFPGRTYKYFYRDFKNNN